MNTKNTYSNSQAFNSLRITVGVFKNSILIEDSNKIDVTGKSLLFFFKY